ncbi:MAG: class I SAM-dependent methyltransferase [Ramlibacter sp.]|nr:class I SAM-dependent methyltransferase [Ramlibacter sp.]
MDYRDYFSFRQVSPSDYASFKLPHYLDAILSTVSDPRVLDFGCGFGQMLIALKCAGIVQADGLDIEPEAIRYCQSQGLSCFDARSEIDFYTRRAGYYDFIVMSHVLEHFPKDQIVFQLENVKKLLKPGGGLLVMVPNAQSNTGAYWAFEDFTHHLLFTSGSLYFVLKAAGYREVEFLDVDCTYGLGLWKRLVKKFLLKVYALNYRFWNRVTASSVHAPSPLIFSFEIKVLARP